ncbi:hypothetical protein SynA1840_01745 [Synechococcus sp. A18-40]|nr:hypothetical protein SynA1840_01745 [Synechococcus sp. A18-40]
MSSTSRWNSSGVTAAEFTLLIRSKARCSLVATASRCNRCLQTMATWIHNLA